MIETVSGGEFEEVKCRSSASKVPLYSQSIQSKPMEISNVSTAQTLFKTGLEAGREEEPSGEFGQCKF